MGTRAMVTAWARQWQERLCLQDWQVEVYTVNRNRLDGDRCVANVQADWATKQAAVTVAVRGRGEQEIRQSVCHELLHLAVMELEEAGKLVTATVSGKRTRQALQAHVDAAGERLVHRLERAFAEQTV